MRRSLALLSLAVILLLLAVATGPAAAAVTCNPMQLSSCASAISSSTPPSRLCCNKIREQKPCLCKYLKNPALRAYINTPNARKVASTCGTPFPNC
ncbi:Probable non-specific lipid-transfer protein AKCS9 [Linum grandiflorum]